MAENNRRAPFLAALFAPCTPTNIRIFDFRCARGTTAVIVLALAGVEVCHLTSSPSRLRPSRRIAFWVLLTSSGPARAYPLFPLPTLTARHLPSRTYSRALLMQPRGGRGGRDAGKEPAKPPDEQAQPDPEPPLEGRTVHVAVVVAMPSCEPPRISRRGEAEGEVEGTEAVEWQLRDFALGVAQVHCGRCANGDGDAAAAARRDGNDERDLQ